MTISIRPDSGSKPSALLGKFYPRCPLGSRPRSSLTRIGRPFLYAFWTHGSRIGNGYIALAALYVLATVLPAKTVGDFNRLACLALGGEAGVDGPSAVLAYLYAPDSEPIACHLNG